MANNDDSGLTKGGIVGLVIGIVAGFILGGLAVWYCMRRRERKRVEATKDKDKDVEKQSSGEPREAQTSDASQEEPSSAQSPVELADEQTTRTELPTSGKDGKENEARPISELMAEGNAHEVPGDQVIVELDGKSVPGLSKEMGRESKSDSEESSSEEALVPKPLEIKKVSMDDTSLGKSTLS